MISRKTPTALVTGLAVALFGTLASGSLPALGEVPGVPAQNAAAKLASASLEETWGVKVLGIRLSAANHILDFRYQVIDPEKAAPILDRKYVPYLVDDATGQIMTVPTPPKVGALRQNTSRPAAGRSYFVLFSNPGRSVKKGDAVTVIIGDFRAKNLEVQG